jgi:hypothetical protein
MHPPDPEMQRRAPAKDAPDCISSKPQPHQTKLAGQIAQAGTSELQARRVARLYAVSVATAATIARLAYAVGAP